MSTIPRRKSGVRPWRCTKADYYRMGELGFFHGVKVELIEGKLMVFSPQLAPHYASIDKTRRALEAIFQAGYVVRMQGPIDLGQHSEPEPDVAVVKGQFDQFEQAHPTSAVLLVEVSLSTVSYDRRRKGSLYARAGVADYWLVNVEKRRVEVYRDPVPDSKSHYGHRYDSRTDVPIGGAVSPLAMPTASVPVAALVT